MPPPRPPRHVDHQALSLRGGNEPNCTQHRSTCLHEIFSLKIVPVNFMQLMQEFPEYGGLVCKEVMDFFCGITRIF